MLGARTGTRNPLVAQNINKYNLNPLLDGARIQWVNPKPLTLKETFIFDRRCVAARWQFGFRPAFTAIRHPAAIGGGMPDTINTGLNPNCQLAARGAIGAAVMHLSLRTSPPVGASNFNLLPWARMILTISFGLRAPFVAHR